MSEELINTIFEERFPLLELPDNVLANVLQRCPPGSIGGFPLPLALTHLRLTGSLDPYWLRPLVDLASRCPPILERLSRELRSATLLPGETRALEAIVSQLTRLEGLTILASTPLTILANAPTRLTEITIRDMDISSKTRASIIPLLTRQPSLRDLELGYDDLEREAVLLPLVRRLTWLGEVPEDVADHVPCVESLAVRFRDKKLARLPRALTQLRALNRTFFDGSLLPLSRLTGLQDLTMPKGVKFAELPEVIGALSRLTRLEIVDLIGERHLAHLAEALRKGNDDLGLHLHWARLDQDSPDLRLLFSRLFALEHFGAQDPSLLPWDAMTRLTRFELFLSDSEDAKWTRAISRLPALAELSLRIEGQIPEEVCMLTKCTGLSIRDSGSTDNLTCIQRLRRLGDCEAAIVPVVFLSALPTSVTSLQALSAIESPTLRLDQAIQHLTALESLVLKRKVEEEGVCDLSPLRRLTSLQLRTVDPRLVHLGQMPCLRILHLSGSRGLDAGYLQMLAGLCSLATLRLDDLIDLCRTAPGDFQQLLDRPQFDLLDVIASSSGRMLDWEWTVELKRLAGRRLLLDPKPLGFHSLEEE